MVTCRKPDLYAYSNVEVTVPSLRKHFLEKVENNVGVEAISLHHIVHPARWHRVAIGVSGRPREARWSRRYSSEDEILVGSRRGGTRRNHTSYISWALPRARNSTPPSLPASGLSLKLLTVICLHDFACMALPAWLCRNPSNLRRGCDAG